MTDLPPEPDPSSMVRLVYRPRVIIIGSGPTSALLSLQILRNEKLKKLFDFSIVEKAEEIGGRFKTFRCPSLHCCTGYADIGAQYLTHTAGHPSKKYYDELLGAGLIRVMDTSRIPGFRQDESKVHYACTQGANAVVKYFFQQVGFFRHISLGKAVTRLELSELDGKRKVVVYNDRGESGMYDIVISTLPVPNFLDIENVGTILAGNPTVESKIRSVKYNSRYAMSLFYQSPIYFKDSEEPIQFVTEPGSPIRYWSVESIKRSGSRLSKESGSVVVHTTAGYGAGTEDYQGLRVELLKEACRLLLPYEPDLPSSVHLHSWQPSQVTEPYPGTPGHVNLTDDPLLIAGGDGFTGSGFEGCVSSAEGIFEKLFAGYAHLIRDRRTD